MNFGIGGYIQNLLKTFLNTTKFLKTIVLVSFGKFTSQQREEVEKFGAVMYSWDEFLLLVGRIWHQARGHSCTCWLRWISHCRRVLQLQSEEGKKSRKMKCLGWPSRF
ncbi:uncharacterized protein LOC111393997 [Olea europaea var. sylvestris]|uniref:uncharacterized protein LOC111393997 n=1 Tax=Olea europaea var. sylvestris TaxID=158386 RepID=UPI000C1D6EB9|nr:uncharacterized protein LOC111393997 [Olea europaea var. sylvestris]